MRQRIAALALLLIVVLPGSAFADHYPDLLTFEDGSSIEIKTEHSGAANHYYIAATLGQNWSAMPPKQHVNWFISGPNKSALDITGDVHLTGPYPAWVGFFRDMPFFGGTWTPYPHMPQACCFYIDCPDTGVWLHPWSGNGSNASCSSPCPYMYPFEQWESFNTGQPISTDPGGGLENGVLRILDGHGGATGVHVLSLERIVGSGPSHSHYHLYFAYVPPGRYLNPSTQTLVDRLPGDTFVISLIADGIPVNPIAKVVQLVSADISSASPGFVDAGDLSALASQLGKCASFCTNAGCQPSGNPPNNICNWRADLNVDGFISASDISVYAWEEPLADCNLQ